MTFSPNPGDTVLAPHKLDAVSGVKHRVEFRGFFTDANGNRRAKLKDGSHEWEVDASAVEATPTAAS